MALITNTQGGTTHDMAARRHGGTGDAMPRCLARWLLIALDEGVRVAFVWGGVGLWTARAWLVKQASG